MKEKTLDKATIDTYHEWVQQGVRNELNSAGLGPGKLPFRGAIFMVICGLGCALVGALLVGLRMRHVYLWDWNAQFLGPFFIILCLLCLSFATYLLLIAKRRSNKYRSELYFKPIGDWGVNCVHKSELARVEEFKHDLKSGTTPHKNIKPRSDAYSQSSKDTRAARKNDGRDNRGYDRSPLDANKPFRPPDGHHGPPPDGRRGPPPDGHRRPPPDGRRGPPPDGRRGPPPDGRRGPPPDGRRGPPPDGRRGPPPDGRRGPPPPDGRRGPPPPDYRRRPHPHERGPPSDAPPDYRRSPPTGRRSPPQGGQRGSPPPGRRGSPPPGRRGSPPPGRRGSPPPGRQGSPPPGRRGSPPPGRQGSPPPGRRGSPPPGRRGPPPDERSDFSDRPSDSESFSGPPNGHRGPDDRRPPPRFERMAMEDEGARRPRGAPRFGGVAVIPDDQRRNMRLIDERARESESEI